MSVKWAVDRVVMPITWTVFPAAPKETEKATPGPLTQLHLLGEGGTGVLMLDRGPPHLFEVCACVCTSLSVFCTG